MKKHLGIATLVVILGFAGACRTTESRLKGAPATSVDLVATVPHGVLISSAAGKSTWQHEIQEQMQFAIGLLAGRGAVGDLNRLDISIDESAVATRGDGSFEVPYAARLPVAWPLDLEWPLKIDLIMPSGGDNVRRRSFFGRFGALCVDKAEVGVNASTFWHHYRPEREGCPLEERTVDKRVAVESDLNLRVDEPLALTKFPEYGRLLADGRLDVLMIFGEGKEDRDHLAFRTAYKWLTSESFFGKPAAASPASLGEALKAGHATLTFASGDRKIEVELFRGPGVSGWAAKERSRLSQATGKAEVILYQGALGLGRSLGDLARWGRGAPGLYQLWVVSGVDSFAYADPALQIALAKNNPDARSTKFFDLLTLSSPNPGGNHAPGFVSLLKEILGQTADYRRLSGLFEGDAHLVGAEDNLWPEPFQEEED